MHNISCLYAGNSAYIPAISLFRLYFLLGQRMRDFEGGSNLGSIPQFFTTWALDLSNLKSTKEMQENTKAPDGKYMSSVGNIFLKNLN